MTTSIDVPRATPDVTERNPTQLAVDQVRHFSMSHLRSTVDGRQRLLSERAITTTLGYARMTVRKALWQLEADGLIYRADRSGWYVSPNRFQYDPTRDVSFTETARRQGREPGSQVVDIVDDEAHGEIATALGVEPGTALTVVARVRMLEGRPVFVERSHVLSARCPHLARYVSSSVSLADLYAQRYAIVMQRLEVVMHPTSLKESDARLLNLAAGTPGLHLHRTSADETGRPFTYDTEAWAHDALLVRIKPVPQPNQTGR